MTQRPASRAAASLVFALALILLTGAHASARPTHAPRRTQDAAQKQNAAPKQDSQPKSADDARAPEEGGEARRAEELCERGEALSKQGDAGGAVGALGESVKLYTRIYLGNRVPPAPSGPEPVAQFRTQMAALLKRAPECIELYTRLGGGKGKNDFERAQLEALRAHALGLVETDPSRAVFFSREADERAVISYKPEPRFPRAARGSIVSITVRVRVVLGADGEVKHALVIAGPPSVFGESSVEATKGIRFTPARKDGRPVSQFATLEYGFRSY